MTRLATLPVIACLLLGPAAAAQVPAFSAYPAEPGGSVAPGPVRLVLHGDDVHWRTELREAAGRPANFAGHYVLALWGCGTECVMGAAVDRDTGVVVWLPATICCWFRGAKDVAEPVAFRRDSRLLVLTGKRDEAPDDDGLHLYRIAGRRFIHLRDLPRPPLP